MNRRHKTFIVFSVLLLVGGTSPAWARGGGGGGMGASGIGAGNMGGFSNAQPNNQQGMEESAGKQGTEGTKEGKHLGENKNVTHGRAKAAPRATPAVPATPASPTPGTPGATRATPATPAVPPTPQQP